MKFKIVFSIPVHEHFEVILDQILNITTLNPLCAVVLHISPMFEYDKSLMQKIQFEDALKKLDLNNFVLINPESVRTGLFDIIQAHISNFKYVNSMIDFEYFAMLSSNELFIKAGLYDEMKKFDCGLGKKRVYKGMLWTAGIKSLNDKDLEYMREELSASAIYGSQIEGSFYKKEIFGTISSIITSHYDYRKMKVKYAREEIYFSTIFWALNESGKYVVNNNGCFTFVPWKRKSILVRLKEVRKYELPHTAFYSVKRVERNIRDNIRSYERQKYGYWEKEIEYCPYIDKRSLIILYAIDLIKDIIYYIKKIKSRFLYGFNFKYFYC